MVAKKDDWKIEDAKRLSHSLLWQIQRNYFHHKGIDAWKGEVPFYVSSNCFIAHSYAHLVLRLIQEAQRLSPERVLFFQIIELGAGTGKFSYYFLRFLLDLIQLSQLSTQFCYTITDFSENMINSIQNNHSFTELKRQLGANQQVEFRVWDFESGDPSVVRSDHIPIIIANYVFDCIQQDKFYLEDKQLYEVQLALNNRYLKFNPAAPKTLRDLEFKQSKVVIDPAVPYYDNPKLNGLLTRYIETMKTGTEFVLPVGAFNFINLLDDTQPYYLLIGDKGIANREDFEPTRQRELMSYDGCYSFLLNFDAITHYIEQSGGVHLGTDYVYTFGIHLYGNRFAKESILAAKLDFNELFTRFGPKEYLSICREYQGSGYRFKLDSLIDFLKLSNYDPDAYGIVHDRLIELVPAINEYTKPNLLFTLQKVEDQIYVLGSAFDTYNLLGIFYQVLGDLDRAEQLFMKSISVLGSSGPAHHNLGILYTQKKDKNAAIFHLEKSLEIEQKNPIAKRKIAILKGGFWQKVIIPLSKLMAIIGVLFLMYLFIRYL